jgi:hypothetical protein
MLPKRTGAAAADQFTAHFGNPVICPVLPRRGHEAGCPHYSSYIPVQSVTKRKGTVPC